MFIVATNLPLRDARLRGAARRGLVATARHGRARDRASRRCSPRRPGCTGPRSSRCWSRRARPRSCCRSSATHDRDEALLVTIAWVSFADIATVLAVPFVLSTRRLRPRARRCAAGGRGRDRVRPRHPRGSSALEPVEALRHASHHLDWALDLRLSLLVLVHARVDRRTLRHQRAARRVRGGRDGLAARRTAPGRRSADRARRGILRPAVLRRARRAASTSARSVHSRDDLLLFALLAVGDHARAGRRGDDRAPAAVERAARGGGDGRAVGGRRRSVSRRTRSGPVRPRRSSGAAAVSLAVASVGAIRLGRDRAGQSTRTGRRGVNTNVAPPLILASAISGASVRGSRVGIDHRLVGEPLVAARRDRHDTRPAG